MEQLADRQVNDVTRIGGVACPPWCIRHEDADEGTPDEFRIHYGLPRQAAGYDVQLRRCDIVRRHMPGVVGVFLDGEEMGVHAALALGALLSSTAAGVQLDGDETTIIRTMDLPDGQDYVLYADANVVGVSSRLDEDGRERALIEAGVR